MLLVTGVLALNAALASAVARFDEIGATAMASQTAPATSIAVLRDGNVIYARGFGFSNIAAKTPATPATTYAIGSISKQFGAAAILLLAQDGKLSIDDPLSKFVEGFPEGITIRNLLNQTSGLHNYPNLAEHNWPTSGAIETEQILTILRTDKPDFEPGTRWEYSNTNYALLTAVVEKVSGMSYGAFLQSRIFGPLDMASSGYGNAATLKLDPATPYRGFCDG